MVSCILLFGSRTICHSFVTVNSGESNMATYRKREGKRGIRWCAIVRIAGHDEKTRTFDRLNDAKRWAENTERTMRATASGDDLTVGQVIDQFLHLAV